MGVVTSRQELNAAKKRGDQKITVTGDLADKLKKSKQITLLSAGALAAITAVVAAATIAAPATGGLSYLGAGAAFAVAPVAAPAAALSGIEVATIITASAVGITLVVAIFKDYEEISYSKGTLVLKRRRA